LAVPGKSKGWKVWQRKRNKQQRRAPRRKQAGIRAVAVTAVRDAKAGREADTVVRAETGDRAVPAALAAVREDHAAASGNISARKRSASSAWKKWT